MDGNDFDIDPTTMGIALGLGEEMSLTEVGDEIQEEEGVTGADDPTPVSLKSRHKKSKIHDPFLQYAKEVAVGARELGDTKGIDWKKAQEGP